MNTRITETITAIRHSDSQTWEFEAIRDERDDRIYNITFDQLEEIQAETGEWFEALDFYAGSANEALQLRNKIRLEIN